MKISCLQSFLLGVAFCGSLMGAVVAVAIRYAEKGGAR